MNRRLAALAAAVLVGCSPAADDPHSAPVGVDMSSTPTSTPTTPAPPTADGSWEGLPDEHSVGAHAWHMSTSTTTAPPPSTTIPERHEPAVVTVPAAPAPAPQPPAPVQAGGSIWDRLADCESGGNWSINTGNGHYGGLQFTLQSWHGVGGTGYPHQHSRAEQIHRAERLLDLQGWGAWPGCARRLGLR